jgi:GTPase SAR1 family protein
MKIIIIGPAQSGKTTLLHQIIRSNTNVTFPFILDGYENLALPEVPQPPAHVNYIITATTLDNVPVTLRNNALILDIARIRGLPGAV